MDPAQHDLCHVWTAEAAEALGYVEDDGSPISMTWAEVLQAIRELRQERDELRRAVETTGRGQCSDGESNEFRS